MFRTILHDQSHLYPCQLSTSFYKKQRLTNIKDRQCNFTFYSPMDSYLSQYKLSNSEYELIDLQGKRFGLMQSIGIGQFQGQATILSNAQQIKMIIKNSQQQSYYPITHTIQHNNQQIVSNAAISINTQNQNNNYYNNLTSFNIVYLIKNLQNNQIQMRICLYQREYVMGDWEGFSQSQQEYSRGQQGRGQKAVGLCGDSGKRNMRGVVNPEECESSGVIQNNLRKIPKFNNSSLDIKNGLPTLQLHPLYTHKKTTNIHLPQFHIPQYHTLQQQSFHIYQQSSIHNPSSLLIFQKYSQTLNIFDIDYGVLTCSISCDINNFTERRGRIGNNVMNMEGRKVAILSDNLFMQYDSMGLVKLIDKRVCRIVQVRDLNEQYPNQTNPQTTTSYQQHFIKFWNTSHQHTQQQNTQQSNKFIININNKILNVDLRYNNNGAQDNGLFSIQQNNVIGNYDIVKMNQRTITSFTTESLHSFKSFIVEQIG